MIGTWLRDRIAVSSADHEERRAGLAEHPLRDRTQPPALRSTAPVRPHHDKIDRCRPSDNRFGRGAMIDGRDKRDSRVLPTKSREKPFGLYGDRVPLPLEIVDLLRGAVRGGV